MPWWSKPSPEPAQEAKSLADPTPFELALFGVTVSAAGIAVSGEAVMRVPAARNGVLLIASSIASLPIRFLRSGPGGQRTELEASAYRPASVVRRPNPFTGATVFWRDLIADFLIHGDGIALVTKVRGEPRELIRVPPESVSIERNMRTLEPQYRISLADGVSRLYPHKDVLHLRGLPRADGLRGRGLIHDAREALALALVLEGHAARLFGGGARPSGIFSTAGKLTPQRLQQIRAAFEAAHSGGNAGGIAVIEGGEKFEALTFKSTDSEFNATRLFTVREIARALCLSPLLIGDTERGTYNQTEQASQALLDHTCRPIIEAVEDEVQRVLVADADRDAVTCEFDASEFVRADLERRTAAMRAEIELGVSTTNEARQRLGRPPVEGGDVAMRTVQGVPLTQPATTPAPNPAPASEPAR